LFKFCTLWRSYLNKNRLDPDLEPFLFRNCTP